MPIFLFNFFFQLNHLTLIIFSLKGSMAILPWTRLQGLLLLFKYKPTLPRFSCLTVNNHVYANMTECISMFSAKLSLQKSSIMIEVTRYYVILIHLNTFLNKIFKNTYLRQDKADYVHVESRRDPVPCDLPLSTWAKLPSSLRRDASESQGLPFWQHLSIVLFFTPSMGDALCVLYF